MAPDSKSRRPNSTDTPLRYHSAALPRERVEAGSNLLDSQKSAARELKDHFGSSNQTELITRNPFDGGWIFPKVAHLASKVLDLLPLVSVFGFDLRDLLRKRTKTRQAFWSEHHHGNCHRRDGQHGDWKNPLGETNQTLHEGDPRMRGCRWSKLQCM
jgi:hypothetical protein